MYANISAPRRKSILPGCPNPGSAKGIKERCLNFISKTTGAVGKLHVTFGTMIAVTLTSSPDKHWSLIVVIDCSGGL